MTRYSVQPRGQIFVKGYGFMSFAKNISKNISKHLSGKNIQELLDHAKQSATDALKTSSKRVIQKQQKQLVIWFIITKNSQQNNSETVTNENDKKIP